jgi:hypothetical protein
MKPSPVPYADRAKVKFPKNVMFSKEQIRQGKPLGRLHRRSFSSEAGECIMERALKPLKEANPKLGLERVITQYGHSPKGTNWKSYTCPFINKPDKCGMFRFEGKKFLQMPVHFLFGRRRTRLARRICRSGRGGENFKFRISKFEGKINSASVCNGFRMINSKTRTFKQEFRFQQGQGV